MPHNIMVSVSAQDSNPPTKTVVCPDEIEEAIRGFLEDPLHLIAWGIMEAGPQYSDPLSMLGIQDLPSELEEIRTGTWLVKGIITVKLLDRLPWVTLRISGWQAAELETELESRLRSRAGLPGTLALVYTHLTNAIERSRASTHVTDRPRLRIVGASACRQCGTTPPGSDRSDWRIDERCRACGSSGTRGG